MTPALRGAVLNTLKELLGAAACCCSVHFVMIRSHKTSNSALILKELFL